MELCDKVHLMQGVKWGLDGIIADGWYVGNTLGNPELEIPALNMQDAAGGFRVLTADLVGTTTAWPSLLAVAATWDPATMRSMAEAIGAEFSGKGANTILGPSINIHRVARGGRNFEYLSAEDPFLGAALTDAYVRGVQSQGVMAVMKHWVFNNQETNRNNFSAIVDEQTKWELYYPPFVAAVNAGASAAMCSYNLEGTAGHGIHSCENSEELRTLKDTLGFRGFVQSDWFATHSTSVEKGLDQDMPGTPTEDWFSPENLEKVDGSSNGKSSIDDSVTRILAAMYRMDVGNRTRCAPPNCKDLLTSNVSTAEHKQLARDISAESIVLLKNLDDTLPIANNVSRITKMAIVGSPANMQPLPFANVSFSNWHQGDYYSGGGSGHITAVNVVTPFEAIRARAVAEGIEVTFDFSDDFTVAAGLAAAADLTLVFGATTSGESVDRVDLKLDNDADGLVAAVVVACNASSPKKKVAVLTMIPGAVTMPWHNDVDAVAVQFLGGEGAGGAWADVLFGDSNPAGRLPLMIPETEADTIAPTNGTGYSYDVPYSEGMAVSYRNTNFHAAFPFGHGLTYTTFEYNFASSFPCRAGARRAYCVSVEVTNTGMIAARAVPQLYLQFPEALGITQGKHGLLKGFQKTEIFGSQTPQLATFVLTEDDFSYYSAEAGHWVQVSNATAHIGESSADLRLTLQFSQDSAGDMVATESPIVLVVV